MPSSISSMAFSKSDRQLQLLLLIICFVKFIFAIGFLGVIFNLFLSQEYNHIVNHGDHLIKAHFLSLQCQFDEIQVDIGLTTTPC